MCQEFVFQVGEEQANMRLDQFLLLNSSDYSRSFLKKTISSGHVCVNEKAVKKSGYSLRFNDSVKMTVPKPTSLELCPEDIELDIVFEDKDVIVINKPINMVVHPGAGHQSGTLVHALLHHCKDLSGIGGVERPGIVHRLDKDTSGLLVVAKNDIAHRHLAQQLKTREMKRIYYALVEFGFSQKSGFIEAPIGRHPGDRKKMTVLETGRYAKTHWYAQKFYGGQYTLLELHLQTGRTHQIRVHLKHIQHPLVGDPVYGSRKKHSFHVSRPLLHAQAIQFKHPVSEKNMRFNVQLPDDFQRILDLLDQKYSC